VLGRRRLGSATLSVCALTSLLAAGKVGAATVGYQVSGNSRTDEAVIYRAGPGEQNDAGIDHLQAPAGDVLSEAGLQPPGSVDISDPGAATMSPDPALGDDTAKHCVLHDGRAVCEGPISALTVDLGDGNDALTIRGDSFSGIFVDTGVLGGPGNDRLWALEADSDANFAGDFLDGGPGSDDMRGGPGSYDVASYRLSPSGVIVTLDDRANDGVLGERDNVHSDIEDLMLSPYSDTATGDGAANYVEGGDGGNDTLYGRGGNDTLLTSDGDDKVVGGPGSDEIATWGGDDRVNSRDGEPDTIRCGAGTDTVVADPLDTLTDCENVQLP